MGRGLSRLGAGAGAGTGGVLGAAGEWGSDGSLRVRPEPRVGAGAPFAERLPRSSPVQSELPLLVTRRAEPTWPARRGPLTVQRRGRRRAARPGVPRLPCAAESVWFGCHRVLFLAGGSMGFARPQLCTRRNEGR